MILYKFATHRYRDGAKPKLVSMDFIERGKVQLCTDVRHEHAMHVGFKSRFTRKDAALMGWMPTPAEAIRVAVEAAQNAVTNACKALDNAEKALAMVKEAAKEVPQ